MLRTMGAFARTDLRNMRREALLGVILAAPLLLAAVVRLAWPAAERWASAVHGLGLAPYRGFALVFLVVLHVPFIFGMLGALLTLDDIDDWALLPLRVSPVTLERYLGFRLAAVAGLSLAGVTLAVPLSGLAPDLGIVQVVPTALLAAACGPLVSLATLALAGNKVEGLAILKGLGLPYHAALVAWLVDGPWRLLLLPLPTFWPVQALRSGMGGRAGVWTLAVGAAYLAVLNLIALRLVIRRLTH